MTPFPGMSLIADLLRSPALWPVLLMVTTLAALTLTGVTARILTWLGSMQP